MKIIEAIYSHLTTNNGFLALAGDRLFPQGSAPQGTPYPLALYSVDDDAPRRMLDASESSLRMMHLSIDVFAVTLLEAFAVADQVEAVLLPVHGEIGNASPPQEVDDIQLARGRFTLFEPDTKLHRVSVQFAVAYYP